MSFIGSYVRVTLNAGGHIEGCITAIDQNTGTLTLLQGQHAVPLARSHIADLSIIPTPQTQQASSSTSGSQIAAHVPTLPAVMSRGDSGAGTPKSKAKGHGGRKSKHGKPASSFGNAANGDTNSDLDEDFDFDKALKSFDKQKIWQEIKTSDRSDPANLLVSHNRRGTPSNAHEDKLAWNEPVLSPTIPAHAELSTRPDSFDVAGLQSELDRVRGNALQRDMEVNKLREQATQSQAQCALLEALLGVHVEISASSTWTVRLQVDSTRPKALLAVSMTSPANGKLRYLGPIVAETDPDALQRLPDTYKGEMGLKVEHAPLFFRRLKDAIQQ